MSIAQNLQIVRERISTAASQSGVAPDSITLIAVTKTVNAERISEAIDAGITDVGENYIQDSVAKFDVIGRSVRWHMIGHLQSNKARIAVPIFDLIHGVDGVSLTTEIGKRALAAGKEQSILVEVNISGEESKFGVKPEDALALCDSVGAVDGIRLAGMMGIAPFTDDEAAVRRSFARLRGLWEKLPDENRMWLSMGMSGDFEMAVREGSNMVRIGTAIFGARG